VQCAELLLLICLKNLQIRETSVADPHHFYAALDPAQAQALISISWLLLRKFNKKFVRFDGAPALASEMMRFLAAPAPALQHCRFFCCQLSVTCDKLLSCLKFQFG
jgi:hypothetical protein